MALALDAQLVGESLSRLHSPAMRFAGLTIGLLAWSLTLLWPAALLARSDYEVALERALQAHAAGDFDEARAFMERANALEPNARTLRGLGIIAFAQERYLEAVAPLEEALASTVHPLTPELRSAVEELLARVWGRIGRLRLRVEPVQAHVQIDGEEAHWHGPDELLLEPGEHQLHIRAIDHTDYVSMVQTAAGAQESLTVQLQPVARAVEQGALADVREEASASGLPWWSRQTRNIAISGAGLLMVTGGALWLTALLKLQRVDDDCRALPAGGCTEGEATRRFERAHIQPYARAGLAIGVLGGAALLSSLTLELWTRRRSHVGLSFLGDGLALRRTF